jgi:ATP-dependent DNA ligase
MAALGPPHGISWHDATRFVLPALRLEADGLDAWDQVKRGGWEGLVAKDEANQYVGGGRAAG